MPNNLIDLDSLQHIEEKLLRVDGGIGNMMVAPNKYSLLRRIPDASQR
jgi:hypothetical protein